MKTIRLTFQKEFGFINLKKRSLKIILLCSMVFFIFSCTRPETLESEKLKEPLNSFGGSYANLWNPSNPYDSIGYKHNEACDYVWGQYVSTTGALAFANRIDTLIHNFGYTQYSFSITPKSIRDTLVYELLGMISA